ncbi:regulator of G protein signaling [Gautieria morchelliformis]|nr:regulator of G protein signaling [Gautieria morchelliformis]
MENGVSQDDWSQDRLNRLPSFTEVLSRRTRPPVDLFMFYLFLQREGQEDVLDFWLDVQQHENLCRAYFKDVRKSGRAIKDDWPQYWDYARKRGSIYGNVVGINPGANTKRSTASTGEMLTDGEKAALARAGPSSVSPQLDGKRSVSPGPAVAISADEKERDVARSSTPFSQLRARHSLSSKRASRAPTIIPRSSAITRVDLISSAERIFFRYLAPPPPNQPSHEIYLPPSLRIHTFPLSSTQLPNTTSPEYEIEASALAQVPDMFHAQKEYCFRAMEQDAFPRFLRAKAFGNLTPVSALVRLVVGLLVLWAGLGTAFALVFLDVQPKSKRFFLFIPFALAIFLLISHQYELDPILVFLGQSETTPFRTLAIKEPFVGRLLMFRALWVSLVIAGLVAALTLLFWAVPGHRL